MVLLPKLLYIFWQSPIHFPQRIFKAMESILNTFVWGSSHHKLSWKVLKCPTDLGGTALPDLYIYYIAAQLSHFFHLNLSDKIRYSQMVCPQSSGTISHPFQILFCEPRDSTHTSNGGPMLIHHCKIWRAAMRIGQAPSPHSHTPLWDNPNLPELTSLPDRSLWVSKGIIYLTQVVAHGMVKLFQTLIDDFALPNHMLFRYLQIRHALNTQFGSPIPALEVPLPVDIIMGKDSKKLISQFYTYLTRPAADAVAHQLKLRWESDLGSLTDEDWEEALANCKAVSPKLSDRLSHLYMLHSSYLTPRRISKYRHDHNPNCPNCGHCTASFFHLIWACPSIQGFWAQMGRLNELMSQIRMQNHFGAVRSEENYYVDSDLLREIKQ
ncbi:hypothetical protein AB205_0020800, partial [Aquarana catesbeiana]